MRKPLIPLQRPRGRPSKKFDPARVERICGMLQVGASLNDCADIEGLDPQTIANWAKCEDDIGKKIRAAIAMGKVRLLKAIYLAEKWESKAWLLERRFPLEFSLQNARFAALQAAAGEPLAIDLTVEGKDAT